MNDNDMMEDIFADEGTDKKVSEVEESAGEWKVLIVDDDEDIHTLTRLALDDFSFENKSLQILEARSAAEGQKILSEQNDIALVLLDVVMESNTAGLHLVKFVRETLENQFIRLILRTGYPGESPEREVVLSYDINGYVTKTELTVDKLFSLVLSGLRAYQTIMVVEGYRQSLERKVEERTRALATSKEKYKALYDNAPLPYQSLDSEGHFIDVNPAWLKKLGYEREEVIGKWYGSFLHSDWKPHFEKNFSIFKKRGYVHDEQFKIKHKDGNYLDISFESSIGYGPDGQFNQTYCVFQDITANKQAEKDLRESENRLRQAQKMEAIGTLAGGIAHDFNNILAAIIGYTEMARDGIPEESLAARDLDKVLAAGDRAANLVKQILSFSRQDETKYVFLHPATIVEKVVEILRSTLPGTIEFNQNIDSTTGLIFADPTEIHQILMNLCTNAFHSMEETGGKLDILLKEVDLGREDLKNDSHIKTGAFIQLSVCDSGFGVASKIKDKIFDPYFTTKRIGNGMGMGLSVVHGIVKSYGGFITFSSEAGKGTAFHVFLPVAKSKKSLTE